MMRMKQLLSAFLALAMVLSMVTVPVSAEDTITPCTKTEGCVLADGHEEPECSVPAQQPTTYCTTDGCILKEVEAHEVHKYCETVGCTVNAAHAAENCVVPPAEPTIYCTTEGCVLKEVETHDTCKYCTTEGCTVTVVHVAAECNVPSAQTTAFCESEGCLLKDAEAHTTCEYCATEDCVLKTEAHSTCKFCETTGCTKTSAHAVEDCFVPCDVKTGCALKKGHTEACQLACGCPISANRHLESCADGLYVAPPTATVTDITATTPELTFAQKFTADPFSSDAYDNWYADFVLTVNKPVTFNADGTGDGWLSGQYDSYSNSWLNVPFEDVTLGAGQSIWIMDYAAKSFSEDLRINYSFIKDEVGSFSCGVYFDDEFLAANPDLVVTLELRIYNPDSKNPYTAESIQVGDLKTFVPIPLATVKNEQTGVETDYFTLMNALAAIGNTKSTLTLHKDQKLDFTPVISDSQNVTLDLNGRTVTMPGIVNYGTLTVKNGTLKSSAFQDVIVSFGALTVENVTASSTRHVLRVKEGTATINSGTFTALGNAATTCHVLNVGDDSTNATVTVNGGTFIGADGTSADSGSVISVQNASKVTVNGGSFSNAKGQLFVVDSTATLEIKDGTYDADPSDYVVEGRCAALESDVYKINVHTLAKVAAEKATCKVDGKIEHWKCGHCGKLYDAAADGKLLTEEEVVVTDGDHSLVKQAATEATCQADGNIEHWKCSLCDKLFDKEENGAELTAAQVAITGGTHELEYQPASEATYDADGYHAHYYCEVTGCDKKFTDAEGETAFTGSVVIPKLSTVEDGVVVLDEDAIANEGKKNVVLDLTQAEVKEDLNSVTTVEFQTNSLEDHVEEDGTLTVNMSGVQIYFDNDALATIVDESNSSTVTLKTSVIAKDSSTLSAKQKTTLAGKKDPYVVSLELSAGGNLITKDFDGKVYVYLTGFTPAAGYKNSDYSAFYLKDDGTTETVSFYSRDARLTVEHFSEYFVARNVKAATSPGTGDSSNVLVWAGVGVFAIAALAVLLILNRKKNGK